MNLSSLKCFRRIVSGMHLQQQYTSLLENHRQSEIQKPENGLDDVFQNDEVCIA